jgi:hypothetical protein
VTGTATTREPLEALTMRVSEIEARFQTDIAELRKCLDTLRTEQQQDQQAIRERIATTDRRLRAAQTGGLDLSLGGLVWLAVGVVATCVPEEVAHLLCWI